ncbi:Sensory/regulatory protein RpfC [Luteitalea pratensis]|uniref:histidine kinase n=1 Tax=Luteitalea pratensis TaxID=1855912 RepID=A0A143PPE0_LUTPR|nr:PAS domain S-box protein [Luteitalea pratensis]AMY10567.1 Sensory/regulatory protein RpfC [Luteitalea pratensis]
MSELSPHSLIQHLAQVVEWSDDAIVTKDLHSTITSWNRAAERMFGYTAAEAIGRSVRMIIPPELQSEEDTVLAKIRSGEALSHFETVRVRKDGARISISLTVSPIRNEAGVVIGASTIARDITDRKTSDLAIRRLAAAVRSSDDAIVTKTLDGIITSWNPAAERIFGYTAAEALGQSIRILIPDQLQGEEDVVIARIRAGETVDHYETTRRAKDGRLVAISLTVSPIRTESGTIVGASKIARDISDQQRLRALAQQQARNTERLSDVGVLLASALEREPIVQKVTDAATELTGAQFGAFFYNVRTAATGDAYMLCSLSGAPKEAFAGFPHPRATELFAPTFRGDGPVRLEDVTEDPRYGGNAPYVGMPPGHLAVRSYLAVPVKGRNQAVLGGLFFGHSLPGMFTSEDERLAVGVAAWASVALENSRLFLEAQEANRLKDEFLAVLSHELRTPLNAIMGYSRLLHSGLLTGSKANDAFGTLERNATWLTQIVDDVLDVSRIVSGKLRLDVQSVELPLVIENAIATMRPAADAKGVRLHTLLDPQVGPVSGDPGRLQQVAWNLLSNAVKFTPRNGQVQVRLERVDSHIELTVSDTGAGIRSDFLPYVFERFRQADSSSTRRTGGLGLGLAIVKHIVEMHGGTVEAASAGADQGASFLVRLPLMIVSAGPIVPGTGQHPRTELSAPLRDLADVTGVHVLAIDDDEDALSLVRVVLESAGAEVTTMSSAAFALERVSTLRPDVLLVDIGMPQMDGYEMMKAIRGSDDPHVRRIPSAALTAFARASDRTKALRSGFEMHLAKPVDPGELVASVATLVARSRLRP